MLRVFKRPFYQFPIRVGIITFCVLLMVTQYLSFQKFLLNTSTEKQDTVLELNRVTDRLQGTLNNALSVTKTLSFLVENYGVPEDFTLIGTRLLENNPSIDAVQLVQNGVITDIYPLESNEVVIGYNVLEDNTRNKELIRAYEQKELFFAGPFELRQGGLGIVGRYPISGEQPYNFAAVVINLSTLLENSGIANDDSTENFKYQLSKTNPNTNKEEFFLEEFGLELSDQVVIINMPQGEWKLYAAVKNSTRWDGVFQLIILGLLLSFLGGYIFWYISRQPARLQKQVREKTKLISTNEKRYRALVENSLDGVVILNPEGNTTYVTPTISKILGYSEDELKRLNLFDILHDEDKPFVAEELQYIMANPGITIKGHISRIKHKDGSWRWIEAAITNLLEDPDVKGIVDNFRDITLKKEAEDRIQKEKELSEAIINSLPGIFYLYTKEGKFLVWNENFETVSGYTAAEIKDMKPADLYAPEDRAYISERIHKVFEEGESFAETYFYTKDKRKIYYYFTGKSIIYEGEICLLGTGIDLSERKNAELQKEFERRDKEALINTTSDYIWSVSKDLKLIAGNKAFLDTFKTFNQKDIQTGDPILQWHPNFDKNHLAYWEGLYNKALEEGGYTMEDTQPGIQDLKEEFRQTSFHPIYDNDGNVEGLACYSRDITHQKIQEEAILKYNDKLQTAQKIAKLGYWEFDFKREELIWSEQVYQIWEKSEETFKVTPEAFYKTIHPDDSEGYLEEQQKALKGEKALEKEHRIVLDNGNVKWVLEKGELIYNDAGNPLVFKGTVQDITKQKLVEMELREQNQFITTAIDNLPVGIAVRNIDTGKFTLMNKNFTQIYGWSKRELRDMDTFFDKVYPDADYRKKIKDQILSDLASKNVKRMQWEGLKVTTKNGKNRIINAKNIPLYDQNLMISSVVDVTEKALAEEELLKINERYEYVTKATFDAIWDWDIERDTIFWGEGFQTIFGMESKETGINFWNELVHPDDRESVHKSIQTALESFDRNWMFEYRFKTGSGTYAYVKDKGIILRNIERKAIRMIGAVQDITKLHEIQVLYQDLFHLSPFPVFVYAIDTLEFVDVNNVAMQHYGYTKEEFLQLTLKDIRPKEDIPILEKSLAKMKSENLKQTQGTYRHKKKNGDIIHVYIQGNHIQYMGRDCEIIVAYDVTEQIMQENEILEMNKKLRNLSAHLQTAREEERIYIAREIHDELGQQLTGIKLDVSWLKNKTEEIYPQGKERTKRLIENINLTINKVRKIATDLRPGVLDDLGLEAALEWHIRNFQQQTGIICILQTRNTRSNYDKAINTSLYRIFQEALTNILRHSKATEIQILLFEEKDILTLIVEDNGKGITELEKNNNQSLGITGMRERATMLNGEFILTNRKEGGAVLKVCIPLINM